jgi:hypothetical protein
MDWLSFLNTAAGDATSAWLQNKQLTDSSNLQSQKDQLAAAQAASASAQQQRTWMMLGLAGLGVVALVLLRK